MTLTTPSLLRPRRRASAFALCVLVSVTLNTLALGVVMGPVGRWQSADLVLARSDAPIITIDLASSAPSLVDSEILPQDIDSIKPRKLAAPLPPGSAAGARTRHAAEDSPAPSVRFYLIDEVDQPASPDSDWNLDTGVLDEASVTRLVFEVFISSRGEVIRCQVLEPATLPEVARRTLEERLQHASVRPALRAGVAVASFRRIELSMEPLSE